MTTSESRTALDVVSDLFAAMDRIVTDYGTIPQIDERIDGTAGFPGGSGLWRGEEAHAALPRLFPDAPFLVLGHNFDKQSSHQRAVARGREELNAPFWAFLLLYLKGARIAPTECFFTNALMGLQTNAAQGTMRGGGREFVRQCEAFLTHQIAIVRPRAVIVLGATAGAVFRRIACGLPTLQLRHPSSFYAVKNERKQAELEAQIARLSDVVGRGIAAVEVPGRYRGARIATRER